MPLFEQQPRPLFLPKGDRAKQLQLLRLQLKMGKEQYPASSSANNEHDFYEARLFRYCIFILDELIVRGKTSEQPAFDAVVEDSPDPTIEALHIDVFARAFTTVENWVFRGRARPFSIPGTEYIELPVIPEGVEVHMPSSDSELE